jgi:hypothetical protein
MKKQIIALLAGLMLMLATSAMALQINYNTVLSGTIPAGSPPWLVATLTNASQQVGSTTESGVLLSVNANGLDGTEFATILNFNSTLLTDITGLKYVNNSSAVAEINSFSAGPDTIVGAVGGANNKYDISLKFTTENNGSGRLTDGEIANIFLYNVTGLTEGTFDTGSNSAGYISEAHIQGIGSDSAWITEGTTPVPEPGTMVLFGIGMLGLAVYGKRRMNKEA